MDALILEGSCLDVMSGLEPVDAVVTDEPYGFAHKGKVQTRSGQATSFDDEHAQVMNRGGRVVGWIVEAAHVLKPGGALITFCDTKRPGAVWDACEAAGLKPLQLLYWCKTNPPPQPRKNVQSAVETLVFARKPGKIIYWGGGGATRNYFEHGIAGQGERHFGLPPKGNIHRAVKPIEVMRWLLRLVCPPGGMVLDPFAGSGTTGIAAELQGARSVLIELESGYHPIIRDRLTAWLEAAATWRIRRGSADIPEQKELRAWFERIDRSQLTLRL